jgi:hypothetical protein
MSYELIGPSFMQGLEPLFLLSAFLASAIAVPFITPYLFGSDDQDRAKKEHVCITSTENNMCHPKDAYIHVCFHIDGVSKKPNVYDNIDDYTIQLLVLSNVMFENEMYDVDADGSSTKHEDFHEHLLDCRDELLKDVMFNYDINENGDLYIRADASEIMYVQGFFSDWAEKISYTSTSKTSVRYVFVYDDYQGMDQEQVMKYYLDAPRVMADFEYAFVNLKYMYYYLKKMSPCADACDWYKNVTKSNNDPESTSESESMDIDVDTNDGHVATYDNNLFEEINHKEEDTFIEPEELGELKAYYKKITNICNEAHMSQLTLLWDVMSNIS